jgi:hypothetical protein
MALEWEYDINSGSEFLLGDAVFDIVFQSRRYKSYDFVLFDMMMIKNPRGCGWVAVFHRQRDCQVCSSIFPNIDSIPSGPMRRTSMCGGPQWK